jgi:hypothetical protein
LLTLTRARTHTCRGDDEVSADTLAYGQHDAVSKEGLDKMAKDLDAQCVCLHALVLSCSHTRTHAHAHALTHTHTQHTHTHTLAHTHTHTHTHTHSTPSPLAHHRVEKRAKFSRRRAHHHDADISYINERNMQFNKKLERFYGKYTQEIRENLERGTAI